MEDKDKKIEEGLAILELERSEGWNVILRKIKEETIGQLQELRRIDLEGRSLSDIGSDYISRIQRINGLERVISIVDEIKIDYDRAIHNE